MNIDYQMLLGLVIFLFIPLYGSISERRKYNNGICKETGKPWEYFDTDSQGGRGYKSENYTIWISYPGIDNK